MARIYVDGDQVKITRVGPSLVDVEVFGGQTYRELEPRRLFPISGLHKYITLIDKDLKEVMIIRNLQTLMPESKEAVSLCLDEYYLIPQITRLIDSKEKYGMLKWTVDTNRGRCSFDIRNRHTDIKVLYDGRILVKDSDDNRYEIRDIEKLDKRSRALLNNEI